MEGILENIYILPIKGDGANGDAIYLPCDLSAVGSYSEPSEGTLEWKDEVVIDPIVYPRAKNNKFVVYLRTKKIAEPPTPFPQICLLLTE
mmetsp:Transcript_25639/g.42184  ORF Transcript_25639/g.42184 Transcript_25639/m.42184 type:complete len:90 (+) Transcript_25639:90-359(+)